MHVTRLLSTDANAFDELAGEVLSGSTLELEQQAPHRSIWVARSSTDDAPLGFCVCRQICDETEVLAILVLPPRRRAGVGSALLSHLIREETERGTRRLTLEVASDNQAALALYSALGFQEFGRRARYYRDGRDALELELLLTG